MSDHLVPRPIAGIEPPYYAVVFTSLRTEGDRGYGETADLMDKLVREIPGYLGHENARTPGGLGITVSYFRDEEAIVAWRSRLEHQRAQRRGRAEWYESYSAHVAKVERSYSFQRDGGETGPGTGTDPGPGRDGDSLAGH